MPLRHAQAARCSRSRSRLVAREYFEWTCRSAWKRMGCHALFRATPCSSDLRERSGGASGEHRRADIKARFGRERKAPLWTFEHRGIALHAACLLSAAAQDSTMGAPPDLPAADGLALNELIELENLRSTGLGTRLENRRLRPCILRSR